MQNVTIEIKALENGFLIEKSWYIPAAPEKDFGEHKNKKYMYSTWAEVSEWINSNPLDMPPV